MTQPLYAGGLARGALGGVGAVQLVPEVEGVRLLCGQLGQLVHSGDHADRNSAGIGQFYRDPADGLRQRACRPPPVALASCSTSALSCAANVGPTNREHVPRRTITHVEPASRSAKVKLVGGVQHCGEAECPGEGFRADQVRFLEFQPCQVADFDQGIPRATGVLSALGALLAVQVFVCVGMCCHGVSSFD